MSRPNCPPTKPKNLQAKELISMLFAHIQQTKTWIKCFYFVYCGFWFWTMDSVAVSSVILIYFPNGASTNGESKWNWIAMNCVANQQKSILSLQFCSLANFYRAEPIHQRHKYFNSYPLMWVCVCVYELYFCWLDVLFRFKQNRMYSSNLFRVQIACYRICRCFCCCCFIFDSKKPCTLIRNTLQRQVN